MRTAVSQIILLTLAVSVAGTLLWARPASARTASAALASSDAVQLLNLVNGDRAAAGLPPLAWRDDIAAIAYQWTAQMASTHVLAHNDAYFSSAEHTQLNATALGENVAFTGSVEAANYEFMNSPGHRANILNPGFTDGGFAVIADPAGGIWVTEDFAQSNGAPAPAPQPEVGPAPAPDPGPAPEPVAFVAAEPPVAAATTEPPLPTTEPPTTEEAAADQLAQPPIAAPIAPTGSGQQAAAAARTPTSSSSGIPAPVGNIALALVALDSAGILFALRRRSVRIAPHRFT
jgi:uncharacterized protein YkwD